MHSLECQTTEGSREQGIHYNYVWLYSPWQEEIMWNYRFADMLTTDVNGGSLFKLSTLS
jgi:hypothetical protein